MSFFTLPEEIQRLVWALPWDNDRLALTVKASLASRQCRTAVPRLLQSCIVEFAFLRNGLEDYGVIACLLRQNELLREKITGLDVSCCVNAKVPLVLFLNQLRYFPNLTTIRIPYMRLLNNYSMDQILYCLPTRLRLTELDLSGFHDLEEGPLIDAMDILPQLTRLHLNFAKLSVSQVLSVLKCAPKTLRYVALFWVTPIYLDFKRWWTTEAEIRHRIKQEPKESFQFPIDELEIDTGIKVEEIPPDEEGPTKTYIAKLLVEARKTNKTRKLVDLIDKHFIYAVADSRHFHGSGVDYPFPYSCSIWPSFVVVEPGGRVRGMTSTGSFENTRATAGCMYHLDRLANYLLFHRIGSWGDEPESMRTRYYNPSWDDLDHQSCAAAVATELEKNNLL